MMIKFLFGIAMVAFTSLCGYFLARKYRQRKLFFTQLRAFNERFISEVSYYRRPIGEFASKYVYRGEFDELLKSFFEGLKEGVSPVELLEKADYAFLKDEEKRVIEDYFLMLGKGDSASQKGYFIAEKERLIALQKETETDCKKYADLYVKIGFLCGLLILILML